MSGTEVVIIDGVRTPVGTMGGPLRDVPAKELGRIVVEELLKRTHLAPEQVEEVIFGQGGQTSDAPNTARDCPARRAADLHARLHSAAELRERHPGDGQCRPEHQERGRRHPDRRRCREHEQHTIHIP